MLLIVIGAIAAILLLQGVLGDLNTASAASASFAASIEGLEDAVAALDAVAPGPDGPRARLVEEVQAGIAAVTTHGLVLADPQARAEVERLSAIRLGDTAAMEIAIARLHRVASASAASEQLSITGRLRGLIVGITIMWLVILNITLLAMLRTGAMILKPVEALVEGSRQLARERFEHRVEGVGGEEFGALADAYNALAEQLGLNEQRRVEALRQLGVSLNHELNNLIATIELQLGRLDRATGHDSAVADRLAPIRANLVKMAAIVSSLKDFRQIVVTEYVGGTTMLDLQRSTQAPGAASPEGGAV